MIKVCSRCGSNKTYLREGRNEPDWRNDKEGNLICNKCYMNQYYRNKKSEYSVYYTLNRADIIAKQKVNDALRYGDKLKYERSRYIKNKQHILELNHRYYKKNRLKILERQRRYYSEQRRYMI